MPYALLIIGCDTYFNRFRSEQGLENKAIWEKTGKPGEGITPLEADTEPVQNINDHR